MKKWEIGFGRMVVPKNKRRIRLDFAYDGTDFVGWQVQKEGSSVQGTMQSALEKILGHAVSIIGAGRTDSGVHARFCVAHFDVEDSSVPSERFAVALNSILPKSIRVLASTEVPKDFHARFSAIERRYQYHISVSETLMPFDRHYCWDLRRPLNIDLLNQYAKVLVGKHDFTTFSAAGDQSPSKIKEIFSAFFKQEGDKVVFEISANGFLWKMVRSLVGTLVDCEKRQFGVEQFEAILEAKNRSLAGVTAPPQGLFLVDVCYPSTRLNNKFIGKTEEENE